MVTKEEEIKKLRSCQGEWKELVSSEGKKWEEEDEIEKKMQRKGGSDSKEVPGWDVQKEGVVPVGVAPPISFLFHVKTKPVSAWVTRKNNYEHHGDT